MAFFFSIHSSYSCEFQRIIEQTEIDIEDVTNLIEDLFESIKSIL